MMGGTRRRQLHVLRCVEYQSPVIQDIRRLDQGKKSLLLMVILALLPGFGRVSVVSTVSETIFGSCKLRNLYLASIN